MTGDPPDAEADDLIPLSALQHFLFCPRQCALIHVEQQWEENRFTVEGRILHEATDIPGAASRKDLRIVRALPIVSYQLGVVGKADVVELRRDGERWQPYPVEYKRGRPKLHRADEVQLCAQALCLEEMFRATVPEGALYYGKTRRRMTVRFDEEVRELTCDAAKRTRQLIAAGRTPPPVWEEQRCQSCSFLALCRPKILEHPSSVGAWLQRQIAQEA